MIEDICLYLKNWFIRSREDIRLGTYKIENGILDVDFLLEGQYFRVVGSKFNDGVYKYGEVTELTDEEFKGAIWLMHVPRKIVELEAEIVEYMQKNAEVLNSPYQSESFAGYSYSKKASGTSQNGLSGDAWQNVFACKLKSYRKV